MTGARRVTTSTIRKPSISVSVDSAPADGAGRVFLAWGSHKAQPVFADVERRAADAFHWLDVVHASPCPGRRGDLRRPDVERITLDSSQGLPYRKRLVSRGQTTVFQITVSDQSMDQQNSGHAMAACITRLRPLRLAS